MRSKIKDERERNCCRTIAGARKKKGHDREEGGSTARGRRETSPLRKLCAHSKDRFKVYGRRIIPFIVLVNPWIYTPRHSSPTHLLSLVLLPLSSPSATHRHPPLMCRETLGGALIPFHFTSAFYERALQDRSRRYASFGNERVAFRRPHTSSVPKSDTLE